MADYVTLAELKNWLMPDLAGTDLTYDASLNAAITAVSRLIDRYTGRRFYSTSADETRYVTATDTTLLMPRDAGMMDILSLTNLYTDEDGDRTYERTWAATDYDLEPYGASTDSQPYTHVRVTPGGNYSFPTLPKSVKLVGKFGYCTLANLPTWAPDVRTACLMQASRIIGRRVTPLGVAGGGAFGEMRVSSGLDPDVRLLLDGLVARLVI